MESVKPAKLKLEIKEVTGCGKLQPAFEVRINEHHTLLNVKASAQIEGPDLLPTSTVHLTALNGEKSLGSSKTVLSAILTDKLQLKPEKWLKLKTEEFQNFRVKVVASYSPGDLPLKEKEPAKVSRPSTSKSEKIVECPYLAKLGSQGAVSTEALDNLWKTRNVNDQSTIKLSFEPDNVSIENSEHVNLDLLSVQSLKNYSGSQMKQLVRELCEDVRQLEVISKALPGLRDSFQGQAADRKRIGEEGRELIGVMKNDWNETKLKVLKKVEERDEAKRRLMKVQEVSKELEKERDELRSSLFSLQKTGNFQDIQILYSRLIESSEIQKKDLQEKISAQTVEMKNSCEKTSQEINSFKRDSEDLQKRVKEVTEEYNIAKDSNSKLKQKVNDLKSILESPEVVQAREDTQLSNLKSEIAHRDKLTNDIKSSILSIKQSSSDLSSQSSALLSSSVQHNSDLSQLKSSIESVQSSISQTEKSFLTSVLSKVSNEQICCLRADLSCLISDISSLKEFYSKSHPPVLLDLDKGAEIISIESEKILIRAEKLDQMIESIDQKEEELESLKDTMGQVKKRHIVHTAVKGDPVDQTLADIVNSKEISVKFTRLDGGNYLFGSTKVYLKLENSKLLAKIKGGFISIEDFLSTYLPIEQSKSEVKAKSLSGSKAAVSPSRS